MTIKLRAICLALFIICAFGCGKTKPGWKTIDMGEYLIDVPDSFNLKTEKGIDSQPGYLKGRDFDFGYDYGAYSDTLISTSGEYIKKGFWKDVTIIKYLNSKVYPDVDWVKTRLLSYRPSNKTDSSLAKGCDYVAHCAFKHYQFDLPVFIPLEIKNHNVKVDTIQHHFRRLVYPKKTRTGIVGVYMRDERGNMFNSNTYPALVISTGNLNMQQQSLAMAIVATLRPKPKD
jgi:hypothetical protein